PIHSAVAASSFASPPPMAPSANSEKVTESTRPAAAKCQPYVAQSMPVIGATIANVAIRISDTRLAMVIESMSETAAKTMQKGKTTKISASSIAASSSQHFHWHYSSIGALKLW